MTREPLEVGQIVMVLDGPLQGLCGVLTKLVGCKATLELEGGWFLIAPEEALTRIKEPQVPSIPPEFPDV